MQCKESIEDFGSWGRNKIGHIQEKKKICQQMGESWIKMIEIGRFAIEHAGEFETNNRV